MNALYQERVRRNARRQTATVHDQAVGLVKELGAHASHILQMSDDKTLHVYGIPKEMQYVGEAYWPCEKGACFFVAQYAVKAATERGCGKIVIHRSSMHKHEFDTVTVLARAKQKARGRLKQHKWNTKNIGQMTHVAHGAMFDETRPVWRVPATLSSIAGSKGGIHNG